MSHLQLQLYKHNYGLVCMTGLLGCRWHRYKQSTHPNRKRDITWFIIVLLTSVFVVFWFYFFLIAINDEDSFNWFLYMQTQEKWVPWFTYALAVISTLFAYIVVILFLSLCHIIQGHQLYIYPVHLIVIVLILAICCVLVWAIDSFWRSEWTLLYLSLLVFGPFLQIGFVVIMTLLTWVISYRYYRLKHTVSKLLCICIYLAVMLGLYITPLFINSPCVLETKNIPEKPRIFAHRGASGIAPENTVISFKIAMESNVFGVDTDIRVSFDGVPFVMHDGSLRRTTNVATVFPDLIDKDPSYFNMSQLKALSAGEWFLQTDPRHSAGGLSDVDMKVYRNQSIPTLSEILHLAKLHNTVVMFKIKTPPPWHPFYNRTMNVVLNVVHSSGISPSQIWLVTDSRQKLPPDFKHLSAFKMYLDETKTQNVTGLNLKCNQIDLNEINYYADNNVTTNIYLVNTAWLFSLYWCTGVSSVSTDYCQILNKLESPVWHLTPKSYLIVWLSVDSVSVLAVVIMFIVQRTRYSGKNFIPEQVSLNSHSGGSHITRNYHSRRSMKEKLIVNDVQSDIFDLDDEPDDDMGFECGGYESTINASDGRILAHSFHGNGYTYQPQAGVV